MSESRLELHGALPGHGVVARSDDERVVLRVRGPVAFGEALSRTPLLVIGLVFLRDGLRSAFASPSSWLVSVILGAVAFTHSYRAWALWSGATEVELAGRVLTVRSLGLPWLRPRARIEADRIAQIGVVEYEDLWRRKNSPHATRFALVARLTDGTRRVLARGCLTSGPLLEAERLMEARLAIVDAPIHERRRDALPARTESLEAGLARASTEHLLQPRWYVTVEAPHASASSYRTAGERALPALTVAAPRWLRARALAPFASVAGALVALAMAGLVALGRRSTNDIGLLLGLAPLVAVTLALLARRPLMRMLRTPTLRIEQGVLRLGALSISGEALGAVRLEGERGRWSLSAMSERGAIELAHSLVDEQEARWLAARLEESLGHERADRS